MQDPINAVGKGGLPPLKWPTLEPKEQLRCKLRVA